jgi:hypothetical protein
MDFIKSIAIAASGMRAQAGRTRIISENSPTPIRRRPRPAPIRTGGAS